MPRAVIPWVCLCLLSFASTAQATPTRFVTDQLELPLRNAPAEDTPVLEMLVSGTRLELLETNPEGYSRVRTETGKTGWILSRYLSNTPSARQRLLQHEQKIAELEMALTAKSEEMEHIYAQHDNADDQNSALRETARRLTIEIEELRQSAADAVALSAENRQLHEQIRMLDQHMQNMTLEIHTLRDNEAKAWFMIGALVLGSGLLVGYFTARIRRRQSNSWSSL